MACAVASVLTLQLAACENNWVEPELSHVSAEVSASATSQTRPSKTHGKQDEQDGPSEKGKTETPHTVTWWCVDLNDLWDVDVPVLITERIATPPNPSPIEDPCTNPFPVAVPKGSTFMPGGTAIWFTNKTYPSAVRAALEGMGYRFHSQSPAEDFLSKMVEVRVEVLDEDENVAAEFKFDPRRYFRVVRTREFFGQRQPPTSPLVDPKEAEQLPLFGFPVIAGPVPPGKYTVRVFWTLSDRHNDGLGLDPNNFLPAGEFLYARVSTLFIVLP